MRILLTAFLGIALLAACGGANSSPAPTPTTAATAPTTPSVSTPASIKTDGVTATPAPAATSSATATADAGHDSGPDYPVYEPSARTGNPSVDRVISAVTDGNLEEAAGLLQYLRLPCGGRAYGPGCPDGQPVGTIVSVLPVIFFDVQYLRGDDARFALRQLVKPGVRLFAVYRVPAVEQGNPDLPAGTYGIVFVADGFGAFVRVNDTGIVLLNIGAAVKRNPYDLTNLYRDFLLPPRK